MAYKNESIALRSRMKHSFAQSTLSKRASNKLLRQSFVETLLQALSTSTQERRGTLQAGNLTKKNNEKQANNFRGAAGELLSHFPTLDPKPSPRTTHLRRNTAMFKTTVTSQSRVSVPFSPLKCAVILKTFS